jgi:hypothetical protein
VLLVQQLRVVTVADEADENQIQAIRVVSRKSLILLEARLGSNAFNAERTQRFRRDRRPESIRRPSFLVR